MESDGYESPRRSAGDRWDQLETPEAQRNMENGLGQVTREAVREFEDFKAGKTHMPVYNSVWEMLEDAYRK
jgi:hypothetical protein